MQTEKKTKQINYVIKRYYQLVFLATIARELGISKQRVKDIVDNHISRREQNYVKALRSAYLEYKRKIKLINQRYGKVSGQSRASSSKNRTDEGSTGQS